MATFTPNTLAVIITAVDEPSIRPFSAPAAAYKVVEVRPASQTAPQVAMRVAHAQRDRATSDAAGRVEPPAAVGHGQPGASWLLMVTVTRA